MNFAGLLEAFDRIRLRCGTDTVGPAITVHTDRPADYDPRQRLLTERFTAEQVLEIVAAYRNGMKQREVVATYGISASALKRLLTQHNARRCDA
jgi:hypothetical protein